MVAFEVWEEHASGPLGGLVKPISGSHPGTFSSSRCGRAENSPLNRLPGDIHAAGLGTTLGERLVTVAGH